MEFNIRHCQILCPWCDDSIGSLRQGIAIHASANDQRTIYLGQTIHLQSYHGDLDSSELVVDDCDILKSNVSNVLSNDSISSILVSQEILENAMHKRILLVWVISLRIILYSCAGIL